jgi:hypothetical protein
LVFKLLLLGFSSVFFCGENKLVHLFFITLESELLLGTATLIALFLSVLPGERRHTESASLPRTRGSFIVPKTLSSLFF